MTQTKKSWEDCCDDCLDQTECDVLVARCENIKGRACDKCRPCEEFQEIPAFKRASELVRLK